MAAAIPYIVTALGVVGSIQQANAQAASAQSQVDAAEWNADKARKDAQAALIQGNARESLQRRQARKEQGNLRAGLVENGIALDSGTGADLVQESSLNAELDALNIRYDASLNAAGMKDQANMFDVEASSAKSRKSQAKQAGYFGVATAALSGYGAYKQNESSKKLYDAQMKYYTS